MTRQLLVALVHRNVRLTTTYASIDSTIATLISVGGTFEEVRTLLAIVYDDPGAVERDIVSKLKEIGVVP